MAGGISRWDRTITWWTSTTRRSPTRSTSSRAHARATRASSPTSVGPRTGNTLYTNSGDYELLFWYAPKGVQIVNGIDVKDVTWADTTGVLGFETTGVWYKASDGTDVNSADIAVVHGDHGHQERVLATGDDRGVVSLFRAPLGGKPVTYGGHSSHVTTVRFSKDGTKLFSCGGGDATVLQWEVIPDGRSVVPAGGRMNRPNRRWSTRERTSPPAAPASPPQQKKKSRW